MKALIYLLFFESYRKKFCKKFEFLPQEAIILIAAYVMKHHDQKNYVTRPEIAEFLNTTYKNLTTRKILADKRFFGQHAGYRKVGHVHKYYLTDFAEKAIEDMLQQFQVMEMKLGLKDVYDTKLKPTPIPKQDEEPQDEILVAALKELSK